jgi:hypothetical protein
MRVFTAASLVVLLALSACSRQLSTFGKRISSADRVVAVTQSGKLMLTKRGVDATTVVHALSSARRDRRHYDATLSWRLQFYRGTNLLETVRFQDRIFAIDGSVYSDDTGILKALGDQILADPHRPAD